MLRQTAKAKHTQQAQQEKSTQPLTAITDIVTPLPMRKFVVFDRNKGVVGGA